MLLGYANIVRPLQPSASEKIVPTINAVGILELSRFYFATSSVGLHVTVYCIGFLTVDLQFVISTFLSVLVVVELR